MTFRINELTPGKKVYFASDFHLGVPDAETSKAREKKIVRWLEMAQQDAAAILLVGDIFDFWFEYKHAIPKGFARMQGKLAELTDAGIPVLLFTGNHDMWMFDYFPEELGIPVLRKPISTTFGGKTFYIGHGDGLGPGDHTYKLLKRVFDNKACQWLFARVHPNLGIGVASMWSRRSRISNLEKDEPFLGDKEWLVQHCREVEKEQHHDYYIFGHRHLPLDLPIGENSRYMNLGEWVNFCTYAVYDGETLQLKTFEG
ncbi:UDP-2,3-diacylglucosamine diphosphatase [Pontibacter diazotrophicus]|uniref:UDP-2,3-diacylglucosamine diphosphatase n=1 Tax=Pontibacter diazotrophicus TaxID=1400979 RepID=A0A3D8LCG5_9BACT|nr:UDP-2,3-diacylglucosamine diphosphatase [Pontibacter diazotrophicus]RDV15098.1 UDP-2,3-diacylglucosamine diphosphatase [Pontibacter diazotrophicus]